MGFATLKTLLINEIRGITPTRDSRMWFTCHEDSTGSVIPLDNHTRMVQTRDFDIRVLAWPEDDGEAGLTNRRQKVGLALRVAYRMDGDKGYVEDMAVEDVAKLVDTLVKAPTTATWGTEGGCSIGIPGPAQTTILEPIEDENVDVEFDQTMTAVVSIPFEMFYSES